MPKERGTFIGHSLLSDRSAVRPAYRSAMPNMSPTRRRSDHAIQRSTQTVLRHHALHRVAKLAVGCGQKKVWSCPEAQRPLRSVVSCHSDVQVEEVDLPSVPLLEPVHDGRHGSAAQSIRVKELHELRPAGTMQLCDVALVVPHVGGLPRLGCRIGTTDEREGRDPDRGERSRDDDAAFHHSKNNMHAPITGLGR
jgi:hypothetical protein